MPYALALVIAFGVWWWLFNRAEDILRAFGVGWADMATTADVTHRRLAGMFVLAKHLVLMVLMLVALVMLARLYPASRGWSYGAGLLWSALTLPTGVIAAIAILLLWLTGV